MKMNRWATAAAAFVLAQSLTLATAFIERTGPELVAYGNLCGPTSDQACLRPVLKAGFPWAYLSDTPGVSLEHRLAFFQDDFDARAWWLDAGLYFAVFMLLLHRRAMMFGPRGAA